MRTFFALDLPAKSKLSLDAWRSKALPPMSNSIPMANFHLTLCFNGETTETQLDKLQQEAGKLQIHEFDVTLDEFGFFQKPAIAFVGCQKTATPLLQLNEALSRLGQQLHLHKTSQAFVPHISLYRKLPMPPPTPLLPVNVSFKATQFTLFESVKHKHGVVYQPIFTWDLQRQIRPRTQKEG